MSTCPSCNKPVDLALGFCENCGAMLPPPARVASAGPGTLPVSSKTRLCPSCQFPLAPDDDVCDQCGAFVPVAVASSTSQPIAVEKCPKCSRPRAAGKSFCNACGYAFASTTTAGTSSPTVPSAQTQLPSQPIIKHVKRLQENDILANKYQIRKSVGSGGMGMVYLAYDLDLKRHVVIKALLSEDDPDIVAQSIKEREFLAELNHANIVTIYDFIREGQTGYIVMQYVNGETLDAIMKREKRPLAVPNAIRYILNILPAFEYLEKLRYVYSDFKPQNVMLETRKDDKEIVMLIDLGTVMKYSPHPDRKSIYGTKGFYAREAIKHPSPETDLYTICRTLAYLVSQMNLFDALFGMPPAEDYRVFQEYPALYRLLVKGTHIDPARRFHSAQELSDQLQGVLQQIVGSAPGTSVNSRYFIASAITPRGKFGLLGETIPDPKDAAIGLLRSGDQALRSRNYSDAANAYAQAMRLNPISIDAYTRLAEVRIEQEQFEEAQGLLERARQITPYHWKIDWYMGRLYEAQKRYSEAIASYNKVRADLPGELPPQQTIAHIETQLGHAEMAIRLYSDVLKADPTNIESTLGAADAFITLELWDEATNILNRVNETVTKYVDAQLRICEVHLTLIKPVTVQGIQIAASAVNRLKGKSTDPRYYRARGDVYRAARKLALEHKLPPDITIEGVVNSDPRTLGEDAYTSYAHYLRSEPNANDREDIVRRKLEVAPWRPFLFI